jgi:hypothetical protein
MNVKPILLLHIVIVFDVDLSLQKELPRILSMSVSVSIPPAPDSLSSLALRRSVNGKSGGSFVRRVDHEHILSVTLVR